MDNIKGNYTKRNADNLTEAVNGLDIFTKNWCMNCAETEKKNEPVFNCADCEFQHKVSGRCMVKAFVNSHNHNYHISNFGSMGKL